jgi:16S rRNA (cytosine967-C5)-methyltransferase
MGVAKSRLAAYEALRRLGASGLDLPHALAATRAILTDDRDRALAAEIVTGTERWRAALDFLIQRYAGRALARIDAEVVDILRMSGHQLLHLDRVPVAAVIDDAIELTRRAGKTSAAGFVNAVLRALARDRMRPPLPQRPDPATYADAADRRRAQVDYLSISLSHPQWLAERWLDRYGFEAAAAWEAFDNVPAPLTLRANNLKTSRQDLATALAECGVTVAPTLYSPDGLVVTHGNPLKTPLAGTGRFFVQDEASQLVAAAAGARPGEIVLDCCASPGGKTAAMAADMRDVGVIVAADVRRRRVVLLRRTIAESGATCVRVLQADLRQPAPCRPVFDLVVVDAPCSGLGTLRRDPDLRWRRSEGDLVNLVVVQEALLHAAAAVVKPGGRLVYATCSSEADENEDVIEAFLAAHPDFSPLDLTLPLPHAPRDRTSVFTAGGHLRTYPHEHGLEAFFAAAVRRNRA